MTLLDRVKRFVDFEVFRPLLDRALKRSTGGKGGRPPYDAMLMFKILVLQALYNLSDERTEYRILDRQSVMMFLGLEMCGDVPDARTIWLFRETLREAGAVERLLARFDAMPNAHGFAASGGQIIDATFAEAPRQRNSRDDNAIPGSSPGIKDGETPETWSDKKKAHKDVDARWTKKNNPSHDGDKNHANVDRTPKFIRKYKVADASVHDSQALDDVLDSDNDSKDVRADSAYRSEAQEQRLKDKGYASHVREGAWRDKPLTPEQETANTERSRVRVRVVHVFGQMAISINGCYVRTIGKLRATAQIGLENIAYTISRFAFLMGLRATDASA